MSKELYELIVIWLIQKSKDSNNFWELTQNDYELLKEVLKDE